ncbi:MAG: type IV secretion system DNA-binding domain-containing protein [Patescibacteria group bacterium]
MPVEYNHDHENEITLFAETNFRNARRRFGIKTDDRRRHMYIVGKTGMGKTTLIENMVLSDIMAGHGVCYVDPHGDTAEKILEYIPSHRINDVVYFNPADQEYPVGFNILETVDEGQKHLVASGLMGVFKKIWPDVWSPRMEYILLNCVLALLDYPGATLLGINRLLVDKEYRARVIAKIRDPIVKTFWVAEFASWSEKYATEAIAPVQNKVGQFLSASIIRNIVAQVKSTIDPRSIMDQGKILIVNLSKGRIGEDNMRLLGGMLITKVQMAAMERVSIPEAERRDFYLYVDEFQNFANQSFANILSEARKYRLSLIVAHQYIKQLEEEVAWAVFGNVGTLIFFRVGADDATFMENEFMPTYTPEDLVNLAKYQVYLKLMVDGAATAPFSANTLAPIAKKTGNTEKVIAVSRERYSSPRADIEQKVLRWSGMEAAEVEYPAILTEEEQKAKEELGGTPASMKRGTEEYAAAGVEALEGAGTTADTGEYLKISPERLAAIVKPPQGGAKKDKPKFSHTCSRCGKVWDMPIQLDTSRPIYCAECLPIVREERKIKGTVLKNALDPGAAVAAGIAVEDVTSPSKSQSRLGTTFAALEDGPAPVPVRAALRPPSNRPRVFPNPSPRPAPLPQKGTIKIVRDEGGDEDSLLAELTRSKGKPLETSKQKLTEGGVQPKPHSTPPPVPQQKKQEKERRKEPPKESLREPRRDVSAQAPSALDLDVASSRPSATVFKSTVSAVRSPEVPTPPKPDILEQAFTLENTKPASVNPLDKRMSHRGNPQASGQLPSSPPPDSGTGKPLAPGQRISF